jgi:hypothetical protein
MQQLWPALVVATFLAPGAAAWGQLPSGPQSGDGIPALKVFAATGEHQDREVDYAAERGKKPTVYVFIRADKWDRPVARFLKHLDQALVKEGKEAQAVAVWLTDDKDMTKQYLPRAQQSLKLEATPLTCFLGGRAGPEGWNVNGEAHVTVVVAAGGKVKAAFGHRSLNETNVPEVMKALTGEK